MDNLLPRFQNFWIFSPQFWFLLPRPFQSFSFEKRLSNFCQAIFDQTLGSIFDQFGMNRQHYLAATFSPSMEVSRPPVFAFHFWDIPQRVFRIQSHLRLGRQQTCLHRDREPVVWRGPEVANILEVCSWFGRPFCRKLPCARCPEFSPCIGLDNFWRADPSSLLTKITKTEKIFLWW